MSNAREFLDAYSNLEKLLSAKYEGNHDKRYSSVIVRFSNEPEGRMWKEELNTCREIRNILSHNPLIGGEEVIQPSDKMAQLLREIADSVTDPPVARKIMTPAGRLLKCRMDDPLMEVIRRMNSRGFSHVPVMERDTLEGVFSRGSVFSWVGKYGGGGIDETTAVGELAEFLSPEAHESESYRFVSPDASCFELVSDFEATSPEKPRVYAAFVTSDGTQQAPILGIITPWDIMKCFGGGVNGGIAPETPNLWGAAPNPASL